jgi:protein pelota
MKIFEFDAKKNFAKIKADNLDDLWILSRIIDAGDIASAETTRIIKKNESQEGLRKKMFVKIKIDKVDFQKQTNALRLLGTILECSNPEVSHGQHHTITLEPGDRFELQKEFKKWHVERLKDAEESAKRPKILLCAADYGDATIAVVREFGVEILTDISKTLSGKEDEFYEKHREEFIEELGKVLEQTAKNQNISKIVIGGIGFFTENFKKVIDDFPLLKKNALLVKISHSDKTGINEMIKRGVVDQVVKNNRISEETKIIEEFFKRIATDGLATYGFSEVEKAVGYGAADTLLVSDSLINEYKEKGKFDRLDNLMVAAEKNGAKIMIISTEHDAGERFERIGIGCLLRFKVS